MDVSIDGRTWALGDSIGSGGFGRVYLATSEGDEAVVKLVPKDPGAQRELLLAEDLSGVPNVVPVIGTGEMGTNWVILMPRADQNLREFLLTTGGALNAAMAVPILLDVAQALVGLADKGVVHRDLKPENILRLDGRWCLTDFGISRYAEATTAADTRKYAKTASYAAPEQWREQRATSATDVYAFGVIAFELLTGHRPFNGPGYSDYRDQHLHQAPELLTADGDTPLRGVIDDCLSKAAQARPRPTRIVARLEAEAGGTAASPAVQALRDAHDQHAARVSEQARRDSLAASEAERRAELFESAVPAFERITEKLRSLILREVPSAQEPSPPVPVPPGRRPVPRGTRRVPTGEGWPVKFGGATMRVTPVERAAGGALPFDVVATSELHLEQESGRYAGRRHSLWFCDAQETGCYAWFETAFMVHPLMGQRSTGFSAADVYEPFAASPNDQAAQQGLRVGIGTHQLAWPFTQLVDEGLDEFIERWATWFARASGGQLQYPSQMPERPIDGSWRR
jgi:serine/threonine-protein kinase